MSAAEAESYAHDPWLRTVNLLLVLLSIIVLVMVFILVHKLRHQALPFHANLKVIFINVLVLYVIVSIVVVAAFTRLQIHYFIYNDPCDLLIPTWMSITVRGPLYLYVASFPLWHLVLTIERLVATTKADRYEASRPIYGIVASCIVWTTLTAYTVYIVLLAMDDVDFWHGTHYYLLTMKTNAWVVIRAQWFFLAIDLTTFTADVTIIFVNRRKRSKATTSYNLSRNYQITENVRVTMHLILPLDVCNTVLFLISLSISTISRYSFMSSLSNRNFSAITDGTNALLLLQAIISLGIFIHFCKQSRISPLDLGSNQCAIAAFSMGSLATGDVSIIFSDTFIRPYCDVYDIGQKRIGFAKAHYKEI